MKMVHLVTDRRDVLLPLHQPVLWEDGEQVILTEVVEVKP